MMPPATPASSSARPDFVAIAKWIKPDAKVLDLGCGDGLLLRHLHEARGVTGYGMEIDDAKVLACVKSGVNVLQNDLESGLSGFEDGSFDYVILSQTLQAVQHPEPIVKEILRVGREAIVSFPNFGYWRARLQLLAGHMPVSNELPYQWYDTPNIHLFTIDDFDRFCRSFGVRVVDRIVLTNGRPVQSWPNMRGAIAVCRIDRGK